MMAGSKKAAANACNFWQTFVWVCTALDVEMHANEYIRPPPPLKCSKCCLNCRLDLVVRNGLDLVVARHCRREDRVRLR